MMQSLQCDGRWTSSRRSTRRALLKMNTLLNKKFMSGGMEKPITFDIIQISNKYARLALGIHSLAFYYWNMGSCKRTKHLKVLNYGFSTSPSLKRSYTLHSFVMNLVLDVTHIANGLYPRMHPQKNPSKNQIESNPKTMSC